jgi:hypothetical protein
MMPTWTSSRRSSSSPSSTEMSSMTPTCKRSFFSCKIVWISRSILGIGSLIHHVLI